MKKPAPALRRFFGFVEKNGGGNVVRAALLDALGPDRDEANATLEALGRARITSEGPLAEVLPCRQAQACSFEVREVTAPSAPKKRLFVAVCEADPRDCETTDLSLDDVRQSTISIREIAEVTRTLLELEPSGKLAGLTAERATAIGAQSIGAETRDVFLYLRPRSDALDVLLDRCGRAKRDSLVLLSTFDGIDPELRREHGPGAHVELDALGDLFTVSGGSLALAPRLRAVHAPAPEVEGVAPSVARAVAPRAPSAAPTLTLVIDAPRGPQNMGLLANGTRIELMDSRFALFIRLVSAHLREPGEWVEYKALQLVGKSHEVFSRICGEFHGVMPKTFRIIETDRRGRCRMNPAVVIERVDWRNVAAHPAAPVKAVAKLHAEA